MRLEISNLNSNVKRNNDTSFKGANINRVVNLEAIEKLSNSHLDGIFETLSDKLPSDFITRNGTETLFSKATPIADTVKFPFFNLPKEILGFIGKKLHINKINDSQMMALYEHEKTNAAYARAMRGLLQNGDSYIEKALEGKNITPEALAQDAISGQKTAYGDIYKEVADGFYSQFDENFIKSKPKYHTPHERTVARLVSGGTAAVMLGNDFYNKSIMNGMDKQTAEEELKSKRRQEIIATVEEAISQYFLLGAFSSFTNNSKWGAPILNTALGIVFHITSRLSTGRPIVRIKPPKNQEKTQEYKYKVPDITSFKQAAANNQTSTIKQEAILKPKEEQPKKKHLLSFKNIALACLASIGIGFGLKGLKGTSLYKGAKEGFMSLGPIKALADKYHKATVGEVWATKGEVESFIQKLKDMGHQKMAEHYESKIFGPMAAAHKTHHGFLSDSNTKIFLGEYEKMTKIPFTNIQMSTKELLQVPLMPAKLILELVSYPYKAASKIAEGISKSIQNKELEKAGKKIVDSAKDKKSPYKNDFGIVNTYLDFIEQQKLNGKMSESDFTRFYKARLDNNMIVALNKETKSSVDNAAIGKMTQLLGLVGSLYFATTDDYNRTLKQTGDVEKAHKDARLRGVNKMIRTVTQSTLLGINQLFKIPYATSILNAGIITAVCTILTDSVSRVLSGMPFVRMEKDELEKYNSKMKNGPLKWYYGPLDKLTD